MPEIIHKVLKEKEGSYYTIGFTVPKNVVKITVSYDYHRGTKGFMSDLHPTNTIDIGLEDADGRFLARLMLPAGASLLPKSARDFTCQPHARVL